MCVYQSRYNRRPRIGSSCFVVPCPINLPKLKTRAPSMRRSVARWECMHGYKKDALMSGSHSYTASASLTTVMYVQPTLPLYSSRTFGAHTGVGSSHTRHVVPGGPALCVGYGAGSMASLGARHSSRAIPASQPATAYPQLICYSNTSVRIPAGCFRIHFRSSGLIRSEGGIYFEVSLD